MADKSVALPIGYPVKRADLSTERHPLLRCHRITIDLGIVLACRALEADESELDGQSRPAEPVGQLADILNLPTSS